MMQSSCIKVKTERWRERRNRKKWKCSKTERWHWDTMLAKLQRTFFWQDRWHKLCLAIVGDSHYIRKQKRRTCGRSEAQQHINFGWVTVTFGKCAQKETDLNQQGPVSLWKCLHKRSVTCVSIGSKYGVRWKTVQLKYEAVTKITLASSAKQS